MASTLEAKKFSWTDLPVDAPMDLISRQRIIGEKMMVSRVVLEPGFRVPTHEHENEQISIVLEGRIRFTVGPEGSPDATDIDCVAGETLHLPSNVPHAAEAIERCVILDLFSPPSEKTGVDAHSS